LATASTLRRVLVDASGAVVNVGDALRRNRPDLTADLERLSAAPVIERDLSTSAYRPTQRATRFVKTRDRTCRFPGCTNLATGTDLDHCRPWPHGPTSPDNLHCLCRHHHRAKQSGRFTVTRNKDGTTVWTTRTGRVHPCPPTELTQG
ncbi:MAG: HNH endonuclease signature motif containing protein, partial [Mycobacteriales bacterium]